ncbi:uncharacterized protein LOC124357422 isoform X1 [Homalodisca vitripennis]|uniref:uncharacterized protein LOC124357422 isoform X1 n=1 Tax=Homalodisca vitripennis TaxID=197043 RepID=UPI001EEAF17F|nr:uncharacterized protein LOC124357422 isoform X1 [Homalodisca vitripennis]
MANALRKQTILCVSFLLVTRCYAVFAVFDRRGLYTEEVPHRNYRLEDFLWTGSGDGAVPLDTPTVTVNPYTTTVVWTTTVLATVMPSPTFSPTCPGTDCPISPTPTFGPVPTATPSVPPWPPPPWLQPAPDPAYWLVTVLHTNSTDWSLARNVFEPRLARLYSIAFQSVCCRQQSVHLGLTKKRRDSRDVEVSLHNATATVSGLELVYSVRVSGKLVPATTAAGDMRLLTDKEVVAELGYPLVTKAEPYLKAAELEGISSSPRQDVWLLLAAGVCAVLLLVVLVVLFALGLGRHKRKQRVEGSANRSRVFEREHSGRGKDNMAYNGDDHESKVINPDSPSRLSGRSGGSSEASLVRRSPPCPPKPRPRSHKASSPNSYLSMPSVKAFPRGPVIPGPLELVLEPTDEPSTTTATATTSHARHASSENDPGVIGPLVWDLHCHRLQKQDSVDLEEDLSLTEPGVGRMRRRFHELLDDAFSLFGSRSGSPDQDSSSPTNTQRDVRIRSALVRPSDPLATEIILRPKTTDSRRPATAGVGSRPPRGAWGGNTPTTPPTRPPPRPLSAGPFHKPCLEPGRILSNATLAPTDPAVPLIAAIRQELGKFSAAKPYDV